MNNIVAIAVFLKGNKILLEKRKKTEDNYAGLFACPGGHKRKSEKIERTLIREMKEELNIKVTEFEKIDTFKDIDPTSKEEYKHFVFLCKNWKGIIKKTTEQEYVKWFAVKEIKNMSKPTLRILRKVKLW